MEELKNLLMAEGADLVGFADLSGISIYEEMPFGISVAVKLSAQLIKSIHDGPNLYYYEEYNRINNLLNKIVGIGAEYLIKNGFKALVQTSTVAIRTEEYRANLPHKTVATRAGLGWIGKCGLLVSKEYGSGIRISSLLTNAKLNCADPIDKSFCGDCIECVENCPGKAVLGKLWDKTTDVSELIDVNKCRETALSLSIKNINKEVTICGKCFEVCPYTIKYINNENILR